MMTEAANSDMTAVHLRVKDASKRFGAVQALESLSLDVSEGEIVAIIGPSGSGKSTLLRCIDLLATIDTGSIEYCGRFTVIGDRDGVKVRPSQEVSEDHELDDRAATQIRREIGYVSQGFNLWEERSVLGNLILAPMVVGGCSRKEAKQRAEELCKEFGLQDKLESRPWQLSGGQRQRVAIIRALMMRPKMLLLDEITSALDPILTFEVMQAVRKLRKQRLTMMIVTHHMHFASSICDRVGFLSDGRLIQIDTPNRLQASPATQEIERFLHVLHEAT